MNNSLKKYVPYVAIIFAIYILVPLIFLSESMENFSPVAYYFIFPATAIICSAFYCSKNGLDFLFSLIAPIMYLPSMIIYNGGFKTTNLILLISYLIAGIFGLFIGDVVFGDKRRQREQEEKAEAEEMMLEAKRRDEAEIERMAKKETPPAETSDDDEFDYGEYASDIDKTPIKSTEQEIDDILGEFGSSSGRKF